MDHRVLQPNVDLRFSANGASKAGGGPRIQGLGPSVLGRLFEEARPPQKNKQPKAAFFKSSGLGMFEAQEKGNHQPAQVFMVCCQRAIIPVDILRGRGVLSACDLCFRCSFQGLGAPADKVVSPAALPEWFRFRSQLLGAGLRQSSPSAYWLRRYFCFSKGGPAMVWQSRLPTLRASAPC